MYPNRHWWPCALFASVLAMTWLYTADAVAVDCNDNGVEDAQDISGGTSQDCDVNGVPDECQPDADANGTIDACDTCGLQLTDNNTDDYWSIRQRSTRQGNVLWYEDNNGTDDVHFFDGNTPQLVQSQLQNNVDLGVLTNFVFALGNGSAAGEVLAAWRRGTDFAWIWANDGQPPREVKYTNPYDATRAMNPEDVAVADGCIFLLLQAFDPAVGSLTKHVFRVNPATGDTTLLTGDFLDVTQNGGTGGEVNTLVTSECQAAWSWCSEGNAGSCTSEPDLHFYDGTTTTVLDTNALGLGFARGRLLYSKPVNGVTQLFLYDTNLAAPAPEQITTFTAADKQILYAQTDGRNVAILLGDTNGQNREIVMLDGLPLTDAETQPTDTPPNPSFPFQLQRGQLLWTAQNTSVIYFDGRSFGTVCSEGWLADGRVAQLRKSSATGADTEVFLYSGTTPDDAQQPSAPLTMQAVASGNGEVTVSWSTVLGATGYNVYFARQTGVNKSNYATLPDGGVRTVMASPLTISGLAGDEVYYFVVASIEGTTEGPVSPEAAVTPCVDPALDSDTDGTPDCSDGCPTDPLKSEEGVCGCGAPDTDTDGDGTPDCNDDCPDDPNKTASGVCGCGVADADSDGDGTLDCQDDCPNDPNKTAGSACGCGVADTDTDGDGTPDCNDNCPDNPDKTEPGSCGCGTPDVDADGDGVIDCEQVSGEIPGCAPGLCGSGALLMPAISLLGMGVIRRVWRRSRL